MAQQDRKRRVHIVSPRQTLQTIFENSCLVLPVCSVHTRTDKMVKELKFPLEHVIIWVGTHKQP